MMQISVVIPVYNAAQYVGEAAASALAQPETAEVILVEDGSKDASWTVCHELAEMHKKVFLHRHSDGANLGAGEARNLGVQKATCDWIAFLDADDYYLDNRFRRACEVLDSDSSLDGICESVGVVIEDAARQAVGSFQGYDDVATFEHTVGPDEMFEAFSPLGSVGWCYLNGLLVRKEAFWRAGGFNPALRLHQDTEFLVRLCATARLATGEIEKPVALRRLHGENRITQKRTRTQAYALRVKMWGALFAWSEQHLVGDRHDLVRQRVVEHIGTPCAYIHCRGREQLQRLRQMVVITRLAPGLWKCPGLFKALAFGGHREDAKDAKGRRIGFAGI